ncbi:DUF6174 domain-containing protein [Candidatus Lucifugimonas marina]|jgi:hypothetical protein|uniref:Lipoprotein n=1 Tax=Candidatus Lucifugimonas marina TaxID=3038979 RepID=A0AAJ5ZH02_9CHLR|nr:hypothetical protein [SAR202 cluster bacterium JH702]MDG0870483.1 hypothetical protein [SAR202 cluster bacterium JH639]WFG35970.1 hypothetical protein GKN94_09785 [SAR202 cluster bacterium JH545]WFG39914.1 hypothetical protein GKO48_09890 [SAR202 cluster bacterium JH1073]
MKRTVSLALLVGLFAIALVACSSDPEPEPTATPRPTSTPAATMPPAGANAPPIIPDAAEVDRKAAMLLGIDLHRQLWATRPSSNYKYGFQWTEGEYAYQRANVEVRVIKSEVDDVLWADNAVKTDGTEPVGFEVPAEPDQSMYYSIEGLFKLIQKAIEADPARVSLGFDSVFGFPTSAVIEFPPDSEHENVAFFAAQLVPIAGPPE